MGENGRMLEERMMMVVLKTDFGTRKMLQAMAEEKKKLQS
jgi:hypothetical protein